MKFLLKYFKPYKKQLLAMAFFYAVSTVTLLLMPTIMSEIVNNGIGKGDMNYILIQGAKMVALAIVAIICSLANTKLNSIVATGFSYSLRTTLFEKVNSLNFEEFATQGTASLLSRSTNDVWMLQEAAGSFVYAIVVMPILYIGGIIMAFMADVTLALVLVGISPIILLVVWLITRKMFDLWDTSEKYGDLQNKVMRERLSGLRVIRSFDKEQSEHDRVSDATKTMAKNIIRANVLSGFVNPVSSLLLNIASVVILYIGAQRIQVSDILTAGDVIATVQFVSIIVSGLMIISMMFLYLPQVKIALKRITEVFNLKGIEMGEDSNEILDGDISFKGVDFYYDDTATPALKNINLDINNGEVVGIIGGTGCGKTTIMKLLMNFYRPSSGVITIGGKDASTLTKATVRNNISIALQKAMIFQGTIEYNIKMGDKDASEEKIAEVVKISQLQELLDSNVDGLQHKLTQAGSNVSGGQKQRINIARTVIKDASIYVFDDSFSALDYLTESKLRKQLNKYLAKKTQIVITQRAATAMRCDKVYVLDKGEIVGCGKHAQLLKTCPIYKEIYNSQLGGNVNE